MTYLAKERSYTRPHIWGQGEWKSGLQATNGQDCCRFDDVGGPSILPTPDQTSGETFTVTSTSNNDTSGGTGLRSVTLEIIRKADGALYYHDVTMNGQAGVDTTITDAIFVNDIYGKTVGSNGVAEGHITVIKKGGTVAANLYQFIVAGGNKSLVPHRMIPAGKRAYLQYYDRGEIRDKRAAIRLRSTDMNGVLIPGVFCFKGPGYMRKTANGIWLPSIPVPEYSIVKVSHWDAQDGSEGSVYWWGYLDDV